MTTKLPTLTLAAMVLFAGCKKEVQQEGWPVSITIQQPAIGDRTLIPPPTQWSEQYIAEQRTGDHRFQETNGWTSDLYYHTNGTIWVEYLGRTAHKLKLP